MKRVITFISSGLILCILACNLKGDKGFERKLKKHTDEQLSVVKVTGCDQVSYKIVTSTPVSYK